jgi:hypothetical protein
MREGHWQAAHPAALGRRPIPRIETHIERPAGKARARQLDLYRLSGIRWIGRGITTQTLNVGYRKRLGVANNHGIGAHYAHLVSTAIERNRNHGRNGTVCTASQNRRISKRTREV